MNGAQQASGEALYAILRHVRPLHLLAAREVTASLAGLGLGLGARAVLEVVHDRGPASVPAIARALMLPRQDVQRVCNDAVAAGLLAREPNPAHSRSPLMTLTAEGRRTFAQVRADEFARLERLGAAIPADDVAVCARVLGELVTAIAAAPSPP